MKHKTPIAILIFGRICSGKTTLAKNLEENYAFHVISKDRCILECELKKEAVRFVLGKILGNYLWRKP